MIGDIEEYPAFQNLTQFRTAFFLSGFICSDTFEAWNPTKMGSIFNFLIVCMLHHFINIFVKQGFAHSSCLQRKL